MHKSALRYGELFFQIYLQEPPPADAADGAGLIILDVGSLDVNGSLRDAAPLGALYVGADLGPGPGVDVVLPGPGALPFRADSFDAVVSTSCFEHDPAFWATFAEIVRVTRSGGYIYVNAPSNGEYHRYPIDAWRFYPDAALGLAAWARRDGLEITLVESFIGPQNDDQWNDCVMVFAKGAPRSGEERIAHHVPGATNLRLSEQDEDVRHYTPSTQDQLRLAAWRGRGASEQGAAAARTEPDHAAGGWVDAFVEGRIFIGWAAVPMPGDRVVVLAWRNGVLAGTAVADEYRADVTAVNGGHCGFTLQLAPVTGSDLAEGRLWFEAWTGAQLLGAVPLTPILSQTLRAAVPAGHPAGAEE